MISRNGVESGVSIAMFAEWSADESELFLFLEMVWPSTPPYKTSCVLIGASIFHRCPRESAYPESPFRPSQDFTKQDNSLQYLASIPPWVDNVEAVSRMPSGPCPPGVLLPEEASMLSSSIDIEDR